MIEDRFFSLYKTTLFSVKQKGTRDGKIKGDHLVESENHSFFLLEMLCLNL